MASAANCRSWVREPTGTSQAWRGLGGATSGMLVCNAPRCSIFPRPHLRRRCRWSMASAGVLRRGWVRVRGVNRSSAGYVPLSGSCSGIVERDFMVRPKGFGDNLPLHPIRYNPVAPAAPASPTRIYMAAIRYRPPWRGNAMRGMSVRAPKYLQTL